MVTQQFEMVLHQAQLFPSRWTTGHTHMLRVWLALCLRLSLQVASKFAVTMELLLILEAQVSFGFLLTNMW